MRYSAPLLDSISYRCLQAAMANAIIATIVFAIVIHRKVGHDSKRCRADDSTCCRGCAYTTPYPIIFSWHAQRHAFPPLAPCPPMPDQGEMLPRFLPLLINFPFWAISQ